MADDQLSEHKGELVNPNWTYQFFDLTRIEKGEFIAPGRIDSDAGREFAALDMIKSDLEFALACFNEAKRLGQPDSSNTHSKALIFSAVVAYARPFKTGVREIKLTMEFFTCLGGEFSSDLHNYLIDVRDKHVAHSVNEFERCEATTVMVGSPDQKVWRVAGVGVNALNTVGLSGAIVEQAIAQISKMLQLLAGTLNQKAKALYETQRAQFAKGGSWTIAPMATIPVRENASKRRI